MVSASRFCVFELSASGFGPGSCCTPGFVLPSFLAGFAALLLRPRLCCSVFSVIIVEIPLFRQTFVFFSLFGIFSIFAGETRQPGAQERDGRTWGTNTTNISYNAPLETRVTSLRIEMLSYLIVCVLRKWSLLFVQYPLKDKRRCRVAITLPWHSCFIPTSCADLSTPMEALFVIISIAWRSISSPQFWKRKSRKFHGNW